MHGRLKVRTSAEEAAKKKKEQAAKVVAYKAGMARIQCKRSAGELDAEMVELTGKILSSNPDLYTLWNIRKECILKMVETAEPDESSEKFAKDLYFTELCLRVNPKSYGAWYHRCWILENSPSPDWDTEINLCTRYLKLDERNFHCWDYRRYVVEKAKVPADKEFSFCTEQIEKNFSNYSSWHYRSQLLPILFPHAGDSARPICEEKLREELELVLTAAFTDPNDSSAWFYQRWLLGYSQPNLDIAACRVTDDRIVISFSKPIKLEGDALSFSDNLNIAEVEWQSAEYEAEFSTTWVADKSISIPKNLDEAHVFYKDEKGKQYTIALQKTPSGLAGAKVPEFGYIFGEAIVEELNGQLNSCNELLLYEPDSKWTLLTASFLMRVIDRKVHHANTIEFLQRLELVDPMRRGYYRDLANKWTIEIVLEQWITAKDFEKKIELSNCNLTGIFYEQYFSIALSIGLDHNCICDRSLRKMTAFQCCKNLDLSFNKLSAVEKFPNLAVLVEANLLGNPLAENYSSALQEKCKNLEKIM